MRREIKVLRAGLVLVVLVGALAIGGWSKGTSVNAIDCDTAYQNYLNADNTYDIARVSYFYNDPTSCDQDCSAYPPGPAHDQCVNECRINRHTALGNAQIALLSTALDTCVPQMDQCSNARAMAASCAAQYDWTQYSDPDEAAAVAVQYQACREASKVDYCQ